MVIRFLCPNGHKLSAPEKGAGRAIKCPKCEVLLQVPKPPEEQKEGDPVVLQAEQIIEFYCPNEHYLQSPARLQGKRGQCPHCGETFRVPIVNAAGRSAGGATVEEVENLEEIEEVQEQPLEDVEEIEEIEEVAEPSASDTHLGKSDKLKAAGQPPAKRPAASDELLLPDMGSLSGELPPPPPVMPDGVIPHPLAWLFERIWEICDPEAVIELELEGGERLTPLHFSHELSHAQHAVFATRSPDGSHTITVIDWSKVARVSVRGLKELPARVFE